MIIGLHPFGEVTVKRLDGVTWPLEEVVLSTGTRGIHNVATGMRCAYTSRLVTLS